MKIASLSVLHQSVQAIPPPRIGAELLMFVAGNREFYGGDLVGTVRALHQHAEGSSVRLLEHDAWHRDGVRFLGARSGPTTGCTSRRYSVSRATARAPYQACVLSSAISFKCSTSAILPASDVTTWASWLTGHGLPKTPKSLPLLREHYQRAE
jgi:hypothetical protein